MKKKIVACLMVITVSIAMLSGCDDITAKRETKDVLSEAIKKDNTEKTQEAIVDEDETEDVEKDTVTETDAETEKEAVTTEIEAVEASLENPAKLGEWVETMKYSGVDSQYHKMYYRVTGILRGEEAKAVVDAYNAEDHVVIISELEHDDLEYCIINYETYFPTDYPQADYGITSVGVDLGISNLEDSGVIAGYIGLSSVWNVSKEPDINEFYAGETFEDGQAAFAMVKDYEDYLINCSYYDDDSNKVCTYISVK